MTKLSAAARFSDDYIGRYRRHMRLTERRMEAAALIATDRAATKALRTIRQQMASAKLGRLGFGLGATSDMKKSGTVFRRGSNWSASGVVFIRSGSPRTRGAIESYTEGAEIAPVKGRWLWFPTDDIPKRVGRKKMTPALYRKGGFEAKIGPLVQIKSVNGNPLLVAKKVGVNAAGKANSARSRLKSGKARKGQRPVEFLVAFIGIPRTARAARIDVTTIMRGVQAELPQLFAAALRETLE